VIADARVASFHQEEVQQILRGVHDDIPWFTFPPGEGEKTRERWSQLTDALLETGLGRDTCILALGGGVTGDLAGFVAATYMRGIPIVQLPTSLVAMIDSSVGGKTGVDTIHGKNLVGAFHPPALVLADPRLARTLPREETTHGTIKPTTHLSTRMTCRYRCFDRPLPQMKIKLKPPRKRSAASAAMERERNAALDALEEIESWYVDGADTFESWKAMGEIAVNFLAENA
jgi:3-dehydroquinate synthase